MGPLTAPRSCLLCARYVSDSHLICCPVCSLHEVICCKFILQVVCKHLPGLEEENRVMKQLKALSGGDLGNAYSSVTKGAGDHITADMLDSVCLLITDLLTAAISI